MTATTSVARARMETPATDQRPRRQDAAAIDWQTPVDRSRFFVCETLTPLYYTRVYHRLSLDHRRRYNQLTGMFANELIAFLEREFLDAVLHAVRGAPAVATPWGPLPDAIAAFRDDEREHAELWRRLNLLSDPDGYARVDRLFLQVPAAAAAVGRFAARHPEWLPVIFWIQLLQEERSIEISRRCVRLPAIEPRYAAVYRAHLRDEVRHVRLDRCLIEHFYTRSSRPVRWTTAVLLRRALSGAFMTPGASTRRVIAALVRDHPEVRPLVPRINRELQTAARDPAYQHMMYSRQTTPVAFELFDRFPEFGRLSAVLHAYTPAPARPS